MITKVGDVAVVVSDAREAADWYREKLGFEVGGEAEGHWVVTYPQGQGGSVHLHLCAGTYPLEPGNTGIGLLVDDLDRTYEELQGRGVEFTVPPKAQEWGAYAMFRDPDGNEFWLSEA